MSPANSTDPNRGVYVQKPKSDIYTVLLIISAVAVLIGILFLYLEIQQYPSMSPQSIGMVTPAAIAADVFGGNAEWMMERFVPSMRVVHDSTQLAA